MKNNFIMSLAYIPPLIDEAMKNINHLMINNNPHIN